MKSAARVDVARSDDERASAFAFLAEHAAKIDPFDDVRMLIHRNTDGEVNAVIAFHRWCQRTASLSAASSSDLWMDRPLIAACIDYAFRVCQLAALHVQISSANERAVALAQHIGWRLVHTIPHGWGDGSDMCVMELALVDVIRKEDLH